MTLTNQKMPKKKMIKRRKKKNQQQNLQQTMIHSFNLMIPKDQPFLLLVLITLEKWLQFSNHFTLLWNYYKAALLTKTLRLLRNWNRTSTISYQWSTLMGSLISNRCIMKEAQWQEPTYLIKGRIWILIWMEQLKAAVVLRWESIWTEIMGLTGKSTLQRRLIKTHVLNSKLENRHFQSQKLVQLEILCQVIVMLNL